MKRLIQLVIILWAVNATATTKFYLRDAASDVSGYKLADITPGSAMTTSVTNTAASGTNIQITATAGGSTIKWLTRPLAANVTISGTATCNIWGLESNNQANASLRCRYFKYSGGSEGAQIFIAQASSELTTSATAKSMSATPTSTAFSAGDRIAIYVYLENCSATSGCPTGTMGGSRTVTVDYDAGTGGADGDSWMQITETVGVQKFGDAAASMGNSPAVSTSNPVQKAAAAALANSPAVARVRNAPGVSAATVTFSCPVCLDVSYPNAITGSIAFSTSASGLPNNSPKTGAAAASLSLSPAVTRSLSGKSGNATASLSLSCPICFDLHYPNAITAALSVSPAATGEKTVGGQSPAAAMGLSPDCVTCRGISFSEPTIAFSPAVSLTKTISKSAAVALSLSPAAARVPGRTGPAPVTLALSPAVSKQRALNVSPQIAMGLVAGPFNSKGVTVNFTGVPASLGISPAISRLASIHGDAAVSLGVSPAIARTRLVTRSAAVVFGINPGVPTKTREMHVSVSAGLTNSPLMSFSTTSSYERSTAANLGFSTSVAGLAAHPRPAAGSLLIEMTAYGNKQTAASKAASIGISPLVATVRELHVSPSASLRDQQTLVIQGNFTASVNVPMFLNNVASVSSVAAISKAAALAMTLTPSVASTKQVPEIVTASLAVSPSLGSGQAAEAPVAAGLVFSVSATARVGLRRTVIVMT